jgi:dienelactone hydrolase
MHREKLSYRDDSTELEAFIAKKGTEKLPLVILCHAWRGRDEFIREKAELIAELGYVGFALDMYGKDVLGHSKEENAALKRPFTQDRQLLQRRVLKGYEAASQLPCVDPSRIVVCGFGFGALCALDLARMGVPLTGVISLYGHFDAPQNGPTAPITAKVLILHGDRDPIAPLSELRPFEEALTASGTDWQTHIFSHSYHAFATPGANDPKAGILYNPLSAKRAWRQVELFLEEIMSDL